MANLKVGILAVQGDYEAHARMLAAAGRGIRAGAHARRCRAGRCHDLAGRRKHDHAQVSEGRRPRGGPARARRARRAFFGTCAGAILLAREVRSPAQESLGFADLAITRNAYGRQLASEVRSAPSKLKTEPLEMVFIRAPWIDEVGPGVEVLAREGGRPVLVRDGRILIATFHPELTADTTVHEYFLKLAAERSSR